MRKVTVFTCDSPECGAEFVYDADTEEMPYGFHGQVIEVDQGGGQGAEWFACKEAHIKAAVVSSVRREYEKSQLR